MKIKKVCSWLLVLVLIVSMFSGTVFADESEISADTQISEDEISADRQVSEDETEKIEADDLYVNEIYEDTDILLDEEPVEEDAPEDVTEEPEPEYNAPEVPEGESHSIFDMLFDAVNGTNDVIYAGRESQLTPEIAAGGTDESYVTTGTYHYTSNEDSNIQESDTFVFREDCFMRSSYSGCDHLLLLSAQASIASASRYGAEPDLYEKDPSDNGYNIKNMLKDMGFKDVETNKYYTVEKLENSAAVAVGHRKISAYGKDYTLLAIIPRSAGYKQEWTGNFTVDTGYTHAGFKAGRDEILRFVKQYINQHKISGNLKVWITGHSRGSALSNLLGGFFAGGGIQYFGDSVTITPEDVYCYTFATPKTIREGLSLAEALSVEGYRGGVYADDTPGEPFISEAAGTVNPEAEIYGGIRNYPLDYDFISYLPMSEWGFTYYGSVLDITEGLSADTMIEEMASINTYVYNKFKNGGDSRGFKEKTFDPASLSLIDKEGGNTGTEAMVAHVRRLIAGLLYSAGSTTQEYVDSGKQETMQATAGIYGTLLCVMTEKLPKHSSELITPALLGYLAYASKLLQEEGRATNDAEAVTIAVDELIQFIIGEAISSKDSTIDEHIVMIDKFLADNSNSKLVKELTGLIDGYITEDLQELVKELFHIFHTDPEHASCGEMVMAFLYATAYGADPASEAYQSEDDTKTAKKVREFFYLMLPFLLSSAGASIDSSVIGENGSGSFSGLINAILPMFLKEKDGEGNVINEFATLDEAADAAFVKAIDKIMEDVYVVVDEQYTPAFKEIIQHHVEGVKTNITKFRETLFDVLLYTDDSFNTEANICNICSLVGNAKMIQTAHYNETYVAWAKTAVLAERETGSHYISHVGYEESPESPDEHYEYWLCHDGNGEKKYKDRSLSEEGVLMHTWGEPVYELSDDYTTMTATRICENNSEHKQTETAEISGKVTTPASCTVNGRTIYTAVFKASCFGTGRIVKSIPASGHVVAKDEAVAPTCTTSGLSEGSHCKVCKEILVVQKYIPATGHAWGEWEVTKEATEDEEGIETRVCKNDPTHTETQSIPRTEHVHKMQETAAKSATCTVDGNIAYWYCSSCGKYYSDQEGNNQISREDTVVKATSHDFSGNTQYCKNGCGTLNPDYKIDISNWKVEGIKNLTYTGKVRKQSNIIVSNDGEYADFKVKYKNNLYVGTATVTITGTGDYTGTIVKTFKIKPAANKITKVKASYSKTLVYSAKAQKVLTFAPKAKESAKISYKITSMKKGSKMIKSGFTVSKTGILKAAKKLGKGTYTVKVKISAAATANYKAANKTVTIKVKVK